VASDLIAQAEHDPDARAILVTTSRDYATRVAREVAARLPAAGPAASALYQHGAIVVCRTEDEAVALVNRIAPEHVLCSRPRLAGRLTRAGTVFLGDRTVPAAGDYATGSNHVLPTAGAARFRGGLSAADFVRVISVQTMSRRALASLATTVTLLARAEGLEAHAASVEARTRGARERR
jgi:histidinol dehydrogenase